MASPAPISNVESNYPDLPASTPPSNMQWNTDYLTTQPLGYVFDATNDPFVINLHQNERDAPRTHYKFEMIDNPIHKLWRWQAWKNIELVEGKGLDLTEVTTSLYDQDGTEIPKQVWDRMQPALQLASHLLHRARPFFTMLMLCPILKHAEGEDDRSFDMTWNPRPQDYDYLDSQLEQFANEFRIFWLPAQAMPIPGSFKYALTSCARNTDAEHLEFATRYPVVSAVALETLEEFSDERWDCKTAHQQYAIMFNLASTLIHELAHAVFYRRKYLENMFTNTEDFIWWAGWEPHFHVDRPNELGCSANLWLLGFDLSFPWGLYRSNADIAQNLAVPPERPVLDGSQGLAAIGNYHWASTEYYKVSRRTLKWIFDRRTWLTDKPIHLHLIGPYYMPAPDTNNGRNTATFLDMVTGPGHDSNILVENSGLIDPNIDQDFDLMDFDTNIGQGVDLSMFNIDPNLQPSNDFTIDPNSDANISPLDLGCDPNADLNSNQDFDLNIDPTLLFLVDHPGLNDDNNAFTFN